MRHVYRWLALAGSALTLWLSLLAVEITPAQRQVVLSLPLYALVSLGFYGIGMLGYGVMVFPSCPQESQLLQEDIREANEYYRKHGVNLNPSKPL